MEVCSFDEFAMRATLCRERPQRRWSAQRTLPRRIAELAQRTPLAHECAKLD